MVPGPRGTTATAGLTQVDGAARQEIAQRTAAPPPRPTGKITRAIANVMKEVGTIRKRGHNDYFNYDYARFEDLLYAITPLMGANGLAVTQSQIKVETVEGGRLAIQYEFIVYHESGESLPPQLHTGMCVARTRKGDYDDKAVNKCHSGARKSFLLSLYQVPAGDFEDGDADEGDTNKTRVPGPARDQKSAAADSAPAEGGGSAPKQETPKQEPTTPAGPHKIILGPGKGPDEWAATYIRMIGQAKTEDEIREWDEQNDPILQMLSDRHSQIYERIATAVDMRSQQVAPAQGMPDPKKDAQDALNWVAAQLQQMHTLTGAVQFWNQMVAPREGEFEAIDWEMLAGEWQRTRERLGGAPPEAA